MRYPKYGLALIAVEPDYKGEERMKNREWQELDVNEVIQVINENITSKP